MSNESVTSKSNSLKELGYSIEPINGEKDEKGNEFVFKVTPPPFYVKMTKRGKLRAFRSKDATIDTTIEGLYNLEVKDGDLVGTRASAPSAKTAEPVAA